MRILVIGGGGREHAICWKLAQSPRVKNIICAPGNPGIAATPKCRCEAVGADDLDGLIRLARRQAVDLVVPGPEAPLTAGIVDRCLAENIPAFGPKARAAELEGSKVFMKRLLRRHGIPSAEYQIFEDPEKAHAYIDEMGAPLVVKADGLAAGKGVTVAGTGAEAHEAVDAFMVQRVFGDAGATVVIEEKLEGEEASILAVTDGHTIATLETSQDHKPVYDGDKGPNTGGMGAYSPAPVVDDAMAARIDREILVPIVHAMQREERPYKGVLYAGLMMTRSGPRVLEFNVRFGDPEAQPLLMRLKSDLVDLMESSVNGTLEQYDLEWDPRPAVCVVMSSGGYPGSYEKGKVISGLDEVKPYDDVVVFHAGTARSGDDVVTSGGRVLGVTALGDELPDAIDRAYDAVREISFDGAHYRTDIGAKALRR